MMINMKVVFFALLVLATQVFAIRLNLSGRYTGGIAGATSKMAGEIGDDLGDHIVNNIESLSGGKFGANKNSRLNMLTIFNKDKASSKTEASGLVQEMGSFVSTVTKDFSGAAKAVENIL